jgi:glucosamine kinase
MKAVVGVDAGGTYTRALCADLDGTVLGRGAAGGGAPHHNTDARANIRSAIAAALDAAAIDPAEVVALVAGIAGFNTAADAAWAHEFVSVPGLGGPAIALNDAEVAHAGAFAAAPGIMVVAGTGSMILGITEHGTILRNDQFRHYAGAARHLSFDIVQRILVGDADAHEAPLVSAALAHWSVAQPAELRSRVAADVAGDDDELKRVFGTFAPVATELAPRSPLVQAAIERLVDATRIGVELLVPGFGTPVVDVALEGGLATSAAFATTLATAFEAHDSPCRIVEPQFAPAEGAVLLARREARRASVA